MKLTIHATLTISLLVTSALANADRFARIVEEGGEPTVTAGGYLVNQKRAAVQRELTQLPPTQDELGVKLPPGSKLQLELTARQIAQYRPTWRIYEYRVDMPRTEFIEYFQKQGWTFDRSANNLRYGSADGDFIDGFSGEQMKKFRIWRKPQ